MSCHLAPWVWLVQTFALWCWPQTSSVWSAWVSELGVLHHKRWTLMTEVNKVKKWARNHHSY
jgi:hypothetical protein